MSAAPAIRWIERSPYLHEARVTTTDGADALIQRLMQTANTRQGDGAAVRFSVGVAVYPGDGTTPVALIDHADQHMYADKRRSQTDA